MRHHLNKTKSYLAITLSLFVVFALFSKREIPENRNLGAESGYSITLDAASGPSGLSETPATGSYVGPKGVTFDYQNLVAAPGDMFHLTSNDYGFFGNLDQITTITSYRVVFTGDASISFGWYYDEPTMFYTQGSDLQSGVVHPTTDDYYYFRISANSGEVIIHSIIITYSCIPTPSAPLYTLNADGLSYSVTGYTKYDSAYTILDTYNGLPVTRIGQGAFQYADFIDTIYIPDSVTIIEDYAFYACTNLTSVQLSANLISIGAQAFTGCAYLQYISLPVGLLTIGRQAFSESGLRSVSIPTSVTTIEQGAFFWTRYLSELSFDEPTSLTTIPQDFLGASGILEIALPEGITMISDGAFAGSELTTIYLPSTLQTIGAYAFSTMSFKILAGDLSGVTTIREYAFENSYWLQNNLSPTTNLALFNDRIIVDGRDTTGVITLPDGVEHLADKAFYGNNGLTSVVLPSSLLTIGRGTFEACNNITTIDMSAATTLLTIGDSAFSSCTKLANMTIPASVVDIEDNAFFNTAWIMPRVASGVLSIINNRIVISGKVTGAVTLPSTVTRIHKQAFANTSITSINLPEGLRFIGPSAFAMCRDLTTMILPDSLVSLGGYAFFNAGLSSITFGTGLTAIETNTFYGNTLLTSVSLPDNIKIIDEYAFYGCYGLETVSLPNALMVLGIHAFAGCIALASITIPGTLAHVSDYAFANTAITSVTLHEGVISIGDYAFSDNPYLATVSLPSTLLFIGNSAFSGASTLSTIIIPLAVTWIGSSAFYSTPLLTIYAEINREPTTWDSAWNADLNPVVWNYHS